jgi:hypothetical protein
MIRKTSCPAVQNDIGNQALSLPLMVARSIGFKARIDRPFDVSQQAIPPELYESAGPCMIIAFKYHPCG